MKRCQEFASSDRTADRGEGELLLDLARLQSCLSAPASMQLEAIAASNKTSISALHGVLQKKFRQAWGRLQEHYLGKAQVVFCTASTAGRRILR